jgi:hypothetical protein
MAKSQEVLSSVNRFIFKPLHQIVCDLRDWNVDKGSPPSCLLGVIENIIRCLTILTSPSTIVHTMIAPQVSVGGEAPNHAVCDLVDGMFVIQFG